MMRIKLQLFAQKLNTKTSIVDYLKSQGKDSSFSARKELAKNLGITNYTGTGEQNSAMLKMLNGQSGIAKTPTTTNTTPKATAPSTPTAQTVKVPTQTVNSNLSGVDQGTIDKINSSFTQSDVAIKAQTDADNAKNKVVEMGNATNIIDQSTKDAINSQYVKPSDVSDAQAQANAYKDKVEQLGSKTDIIDQSTWDAMNNAYTQSPAVTEAFNYTNSMLEQLKGGRTSYTDKLEALMNDIQNREKFSYDVNSDTLFQQALSSAMSSGKTAMQDTIGQASALTGGYGSTYATTAGNQAYNAYIQDAYNNLPEYYQMALEAYQMEGQDMYQQLAMLSDADANEYNRMYNAWNASFNTAQTMYQNEYGQWQDSVNNAYNSANLQLNEHGQLYDQAYNTYSMLANDAQTKYQNSYNEWQTSVNNAYNSANLQLNEFGQMYDQAYNTYTALANDAQNKYMNEYNKWADEINNAMNYANMANSDYWNNAKFNEDIRQFNANVALERDQMAQRKSEFDAEMDYKNNALAYDNQQFIALNDVNGDGVVDYNDTQAKTDAEAGKFKDPTKQQLDNALKVYEEQGEDAYIDYLSKLPADVDLEQIDLHVEANRKVPWTEKVGERFKDAWENLMK